MSTASITAVPAEILGEVFRFLFIGTLVIPSPKFATLWSISQTCSQWRGVALDLRYLWNNVAVGAPAHLHECRPILHLVDQCLLRSRGIPISVQIYESHLWDLCGGSPLTKLLIPYAAKIQCLSLGASIDLSELVTPALEELETTICGPGATELISLIKRSKCTILRLRVYRGEIGCHRLLKVTPSLEEFRTDSTLPVPSIHRISRGTICPALRSVHCQIMSRKTFDEFIDMLSSRSTSTTFSPIVDVSLVLEFHLGVWGMKKIRALQDQGIEIYVKEFMKQSPDNDSDAGDEPGGYNSDKVCSLIFQ
ncbi:hypothetical protein BDZ94DRAFT_1324186 [Collybia nuda]|uniref:F-box domain-containing protein n=1 Tax=Collybia nuda TaxID=64659 RepID=A0A9P5Y0C8_9AGAR|nr:hypothetical protein BDZ94DRAFT_1324186 [Collybia nuda]